MKKSFFYLTTLSNWMIGYDRYSRGYSKTNIKKSTYPNEFYVLKEDEIYIGLEKAKRLLAKTSIHNDAIIRIETFLNPETVAKNVKSGKGWVIQQNFIPVIGCAIFLNDLWFDVTVEDLTARAFLLNSQALKNYSDLVPRTLSILPIALACQARCWFCFSETSISKEKEKFRMDTKNLAKVCIQAKKAGAERFVITGGGEPGLLKFDNLTSVIKTAKRHFYKTILITNGMFISKENKTVATQKIQELIDSGLSVLCISKHSENPETNKQIMGADTNTDFVLETILTENLNIKKRLICVLQKMGVHDSNSIAAYLSYATKYGVEQVCFKELYVASTLESLYSKSKENKYSETQQVSLSVVMEFLNEQGFQETSKLPWGSPVFKGFWNGKRIEIAAYTEPSVGWERLNGIARSWNLMADGRCYASLEDLNSLIEEKV